LSEYYQSDQSIQHNGSGDQDPSLTPRWQAAEPVVQVPVAFVTPVEQLDRKVPGFAQMFLVMFLFLIVSGFISGIVALACVLWGMYTGADLTGMGAGQGTALLWATAAGNTIGALVCLLMGKVWSGRSWSEILPFKRVNLWSLLPLTMAVAGLSILLSEVDNLLQHVMPMPQFLLEMMGDMVMSGFLSFILLVLVAPWTEELIFRGFVFNGFRKRYQPRNAVILSALGFSILHLNPYQLFGTFVLGLLLGWVRLRTGSLWPCIFLHAVFNGLVFVVLVLPVEIPGYNLSGVHRFQPWWFDAAGAGLALGGFYAAWRLMLVRPRTGTVHDRW
jgi:membrane protease YdiL (CAAX protease family)